MLAEEMGGGSGPPGWDGQGATVPLVPGPGCSPGEAPKARTHLDAHRGSRSPQPHSRAAAAPQLSTSPRHTRAPTALCPAPQGRLRHNTTASPHLTLMLSQSPAPCRCPAWHTGISGMLFTQRGPGTLCTSRGHQQCGSRKPSSLLVGAGAAWHRCSPLLWAHEAHLRPGEAGLLLAWLCSRATQPHRHAELPLQGHFWPCFVPLCKVLVPRPH